MTQNDNSNNITIKNEKHDGVERKTSGKKVSDKKASTGKTSGKKVSDKKASTGKASGKKVSDKKASTGKTSGKKVSDKKVSTGKTSGKKISDKKTSDRKKIPSPKAGAKSSKEDLKTTLKAQKNSSNKPADNQAATAALNAVTFILNTVLTVIFYIIVVLAVVKACNTVYEFGYQIYGNVSAEAAPGHTVNLVIEDGETTMNVASKLEMNNVIENKYTFYIRTKLSGKSIFPGTYQVNSSMNYQQILDVIADYDTALENLEDKAKEQ